MTWRDKEIEWLVRILFAIGGIVVTIIGSWVASKIRIYDDNRKAHLDDLKQRVLIPLRKHLQDFRSMVSHLTPVVFVEMSATTHFDEKAKATEEPIEKGDVLVAAFPGAKVFGLLDPALLEDARKNHYAPEMKLVDEFVGQWSAHAGECHVWVSKIAQQILARTGLESFPPRHTRSDFRPYAMHLRLAVFVYKRLFRQPTQALRVEQMNQHCEVVGDGYTAAVGSREQMENLTVQIDKLLESEESTARGLHDRAAKLQDTFQKVMQKLDYTIAARRLRKRCDLVTFF